MLRFVLGLMLLAVPVVVEAQTPVRGGTVVQAIAADPPTMNPGTTTDTQAWALMGKLFNGLTHLDNDYRSHPDLAESWTVSADGLTYTFKLRRDVKWHDGKPFTSEDVKYSYTEVLPKYHPVGRLSYSLVTAVETPDPYTAVVKFKAPFGPFVFMTALNTGPILPRHLLAGQDFMTYLDRVILRVMPNPASRVLAFEKGEVDVLYTFFLPVEQAGRLKAMPGLVVKDFMLFPEVVTLFFNIKDSKPLEDIRVRQAIAHAIDKKFLVEKGYFGQGRPAISPIPSNLAWAHNPKVPVYAYDPVGAAALLDEAGYPKGANGERMTLRFVYDPANSAANKASEVVAQQLRALGINAKQVPLERSLMLEKVYKNYDFDIHIHNYTTYGDPGVGVARVYVCDNIRPAPFANVSRYCNPKLDELFRQGASATTQAERAKYYYPAQEILMRDLPAIPLFEYGDTNVARGRVQNIFKSLSSHERWDEVWVSDGK